MRRWWPIVLCLLLAAAPAWAQAPEEDGEGRSVTPFLRNVLRADTPITLEADRIEYDEATQTYAASGNVEMRQDDHRITATNMSLDLGGKVLYADGDIRLIAPEGEVRAETLELRLDTETAVIARASFVVKRDDVTYFLSGRRIEKIGPERYIIHEGQYTTCDCGPDEADWIVTAEYIDVTFDGYAVVEHGRVAVFGQPVVYVPYGVFPAKVNRSTGFLWPTTGWSSDDGYRVGLPFYWNIDRHVDATLDTDWYEKRGTKLGLQERYFYNSRWYGEANVDYLQDRLEDNEQRWSLAHEQQFNPAGQLYIRDRVNLVSDNEYAVDFPRDISARYDRFIRSDVIVNNLWENYDVNAAVQHWDNLSLDDNSATWQRYPQARLDSVFQSIGPTPILWRTQTGVTNFYRQKVSVAEQAIDAAGGHHHPYYFLTDGRRATLEPEIAVPLNFHQVATLTPYVLGQGAFYQLNDREEDRSPSWLAGEAGADLYTRFERVFPIALPTLRGLKHQIEPAVGYRYRDEPDQEKTPIFDEIDRLARVSALTYGLTNRLWMRLFDARGKRYSSFKLTDVRVLHGYDFAEADRVLDPADPEDERRPWLPWRIEMETVAMAGRFVDKVIARGDLEYDTYQDDVTGFNILGALGTVNDDALGVEYRHHVDEEGEVDIDFISGTARYNLLSLLTFDYLTRYSFIDEYFIETRYGVEFHSLQHCWNLRLDIEHREIPESETVYLLMTDLTGLVRAGTAF